MKLPSLKKYLIYHKVNKVSPTKAGNKKGFIYISKIFPASSLLLSVFILKIEIVIFDGFLTNVYSSN